MHIIQNLSIMKVIVCEGKYLAAYGKTYMGIEVSKGQIYVDVTSALSAYENYSSLQRKQ